MSSIMDGCPLVWLVSSVRGGQSGRDRDISDKAGTGGKYFGQSLGKDTCVGDHIGSNSESIGSTNCIAV